MSTRLPVELEIDLRQYARTLRDPEEFVTFWGGLSRHLVGKPLREGTTHEIEHPRDGILRLTIISLPPDGSLVSHETLFAVHSILERPTPTNFCARCDAAGVRRHGAYTCVVCQRGPEPARVCESHVSILTGGMRLDDPLQATCDLHVPQCKCGQQASFWCVGPRCGRGAAWCDRHRKQHPNDQETVYCPDCYEEVFPTCTHSRSQCRLTATSACEYVSDGRSCGRRSCSLHDLRWQIYGPHKIGLGLCELHRRMKERSDEEILHQVVAATAVRRLKSRDDRQGLPSLQSVRNILLNARAKFYDLTAVNDMFASLSRRLGGRDSLERMMSSLLRRHEPRRAADLARDEEERRVGMELFEKLVAEVRRRRWHEIADQLAFSDYRPATNRLYIKLPVHLRGRLAGTNHRTFNQLSRVVGASIDFERGE
jgi:hypothetical protein